MRVMNRRTLFGALLAAPLAFFGRWGLFRPQRPQKYIDVHCFHSRCNAKFPVWADGVHDDTANIQAAIDRAAQEPDTLVVFPAGACRISTAIHLAACGFIRRI
jgi:hypothetical protein